MAVIKYYEYGRGSFDRRSAVYARILNPSCRGKIMTRTEAEEYIAKQGLELVVNNEYGKIWDTPDRRLYEQLLQLKEYGSLEYRNALEGEDR